MTCGVDPDQNMNKPAGDRASASRQRLNAKILLIEYAVFGASVIDQQKYLTPPIHHKYPQLTTSALKMGSKKSPFNLQTCARSNILALEPYRCARE